MNPAERLLHLYDSLVSYQPDTAMVKAWAAVFGLDAESPALEDEVIDCLTALRNQMDFTKRLLTERYMVPLQLLEPGFQRFRNVASPAVMHQPWSSVRGNIQPPEHRQAFRWGAWVLKLEAEEEMPSETMRALSDELEALRATLVKVELSDYLREFIQRQVDAISSALRLYKVQGVRPVADAMRKVAGDMVTTKEQLQKETEAAPEEAKGVLAKVAAFITRTATVCDDLDKIKTAGESAVSIAASVGPLVLPFASKVLGQ